MEELSLKKSIRIPAEISIKSIHIPLDHKTFYLFLYGAYAALDIIDRSLLNIHTIMQMFMMIVIAGLSSLLLLQKGGSVYKMIGEAVIIGVFTIAAFATNRTNMILIGLFVLTAEYTDFHSLVKVSICCTLPALLFVIGCSLIGVIPDYIFVHKGMKAHSLGYSYYANVPYTLMFNMIAYLYLRGKRLKWLEVGVLLVINQIIFSFSTTRLTYYIFLGVLALYVVFVKLSLFKDVNRGLLKAFALVAYPSAFAVTIWSAWHYSNESEFWKSADDLFNTRISLSNKAFGMYSVKPFGQYIKMLGNAYGNNVTQYTYFYIDSGYVYSLLGYGIVFTAVLLSAYSFLMWYACRTNNKPLLVWTFALLVFTVINNAWTSITYNPLLMYLMIAVKNVRSLKFEDLKRKCEPWLSSIFRYNERI